MIGEMRIHTINKNQMDEFIEVFRNEFIPHAEESGVSISFTWVNDERTKFAWALTLQEGDEREAAHDRFVSTEWYAQNKTRMHSYFAHTDVILGQTID